VGYYEDKSESQVVRLRETAPLVPENLEGGHCQNACNNNSQMTNASVGVRLGAGYFRLTKLATSC